MESSRLRLAREAARRAAPLCSRCLFYRATPRDHVCGGVRSQLAFIIRGVETHVPAAYRPRKLNISVLVCKAGMAALVQI